MKLVNWRDTAELIGIAAIVASLVFVALEIRQNTKATRSATLQAISEQSMASSFAVAGNADIRNAWHTMNIGQEPTTDEKIILNTMYTAFIRVQENRYFQQKIGVIDGEMLQAFGTKGRAYRRPFFRQYWSNNKDYYTPGFREYVERELLSLPPEKPASDKQ